MCEWRINKGKIYDHIKHYQKAIEQDDQGLKITDKEEKQLIRKINLSKTIVLIKNESFLKAEEILSKIKD